MKALVCDQCGTHNDPTHDVCTLCNDPLAEERGKRHKKTRLTNMFMAIIVTAVCVFLPGLLLYGYFAWNASLEENTVPVWVFLGVYALLWVVGLVVARTYAPKDKYEMYSDNHGNHSFNPIKAHRQQMDESHMAVGCLLSPVQMVISVWTQVAEDFSDKRS